MLFVFLSHFGWVYFSQNGASDYLRISALIGQVASPAFMIISGMMLGYLYRTSGGDFAGIRAKLIDRALFLLTIGRVFILIAHIPAAGGLWAALHWGFITDAIAFSLIAGSILITLLEPKERILLAMGTFAVSSWLMVSWHPHSKLLWVVQETLVGTTGLRHLAFIFPFLPWFSLYLASTCLGQHLGECQVAGQPMKAARTFRKIALAAVCLSLSLAASVVLLQSLGLLETSGPLSQLTSPFHKLPPSLSFFLFYGGIGLLIACALFQLEQGHRARAYLTFTSLLGRTSLFVFVVQYYLYFSLFFPARLPFSFVWPIYLALSVVLIGFVAKKWHEQNGNRLFTVGYSPKLDQTIASTVSGVLEWRTVHQRSSS